MKILIVGSNGMAGHVVAKYLQQQGHNITTVARNNANYLLDIEDTKLTNQFFEESKHNFKDQKQKADKHPLTAMFEYNREKAKQN